jgi:endonuclease VIII
MAEQGSRPIHDVLLDQRVLSGIGNVLKSEVLFVARVNPFTAVSQIDEPTFARVMDVSIRLMQMNILESASMPPVFGRRTTGSLDPSARLFVYGRAGKPCRKCGTRIEMTKLGVEARLTYWCPACQSGGNGR